MRLHRKPSCSGAAALLLASWVSAGSARAQTLERSHPPEQPPSGTVEYVEIGSPGARRLGIVNVPAAGSPYVGVLFIQGYTCSSIDLPHQPDHPYRRFVEGLADRGYLVLRVEKSGLSASEGTPCSEVDFDTEVADYRHALTWLRARGDVRAVALFGHSMGGVIASVLAADQRVDAVIVYGTDARPWREYEVINQRRQLDLAGYSAEEIAALEQRLLEFQRLLYDRRVSPGEILAENPELRFFAQDAAHINGRHYSYFQQLAALSTQSIWRRINAPVLALYGVADYTTDAEGHQQIAHLVNAAHPGAAQFESVAGSDHSFQAAGTQTESYNAMRNGNALSYTEEPLLATTRWLSATILGPPAAVEPSRTRFSCDCNAPGDASPGRPVALGILGMLTTWILLRSRAARRN